MGKIKEYGFGQDAEDFLSKPVVDVPGNRAIPAGKLWVNQR